MSPILKLCAVFMGGLLFGWLWKKGCWGVAFLDGFLFTEIVTIEIMENRVTCAIA